ncbi:MAG: hydroxymethylglutaryl-CoA reductase, degradative [Chloroflexota bacterium]|nr:hydroxymethylglutaryl-CoA reductase, degradative [Chloroflexota bacterium]
MNDENKKKFYQLTIPKRLAQLAQDAHLNDETLAMLTEGISLDIADRMIENVVGIQGLPLGVAQHFIVNGREVLVPMAIEEPSVVAGASFMAKLARSNGGFRASSSAPEMIGQLQVLDVKDPHQAVKKLQEHKKELLEEARGVNTFMVNIGGGPRDIEVRLIKESPIGIFIVLHLIYDVRDAMGANTINSVMEHLSPIVEDLTGGRAHLAILSNLADRRLTRSSVTIPMDTLAFDDFSGEEVRDGVIEAWAFAVADPYRAATHNKGIMNGVDAVAIATGNDWRGIEAGAHAYAARSRGYTSLSTWEKDSQGNLHGVLEMPMAVGIVGGATQANPVAKACIKMMGVQTGNELAEIIVSVGLAQNLAALRALATEGIQRGHMKLHARKTDRTK